MSTTGSLAPRGHEQPSLPPNFLKEIIDEFHRDRQSYAGEELMDRITERLRNIGVTVPHLVVIAWKIAILRDHMIRIDPVIFQRTIEQILATPKAVVFLELPEVQAILSTREGMSVITNRLIAIFHGTTGNATPVEENLVATRRGVERLTK